MNPWILSTSDPAEGSLYLSNGYIGTTLPGASIISPQDAAPCYIRGVYNDTGTGGIDRLARVPDWNRLWYGRASSLREYRRDLDLRHGCVRTSCVLDEERGAIAIEQVTFASRADPHRMVSRIMLQTDFDGEVDFYGSLEAHPGDVDVVEFGGDQRSLWILVRTPKYGIDVAITLAVMEGIWCFDDDAGPRGVTRRLSAPVKAGVPVTLTQVAQVATGLDHPSPLDFAKAPPPRFEDLHAGHELAWERLWETDIEIDGDPETQQFARAALYYLWSTIREDDRWSIAPMGLSSNGYNGHIFWDAELWMYPSLLVTHPRMALACLNYREQTISAARARAQSGGFSGARFPWEGGFTGEEMTPEWAEPRELQIHITADVALACWWYFLQTRDIAWLRAHGFPIMAECSSFWLSRVEYNGDKDRYEIRDVQCADEYAIGVDNDAFTNAAVRLSLLATIRAAALLDLPVNHEWQIVADGIHIPYDGQTRRHLEYDGYDGQVTKQADVELLAYPLEYVTDPDQIARDLDYYSRMIDPNGPAMSFSVYAIVAAQLGRSDDAYRYLQRSYLPNTRPPFWSFSETPTNNEFFFCTGVGGALQSLLFGFAGLRFREGYFVLAPALPEQWSALRLRNLYVAGGRLDIEMVSSGITLRRTVEDTALVAEIGRKGEGTDVRMRWETRAEMQPEVAIGQADGAAWERYRPALDEPVPLPREWGDGIRLRVTIEEREILDVLLRRLP